MQCLTVCKYLKSLNELKIHPSVLSGRGWRNARAIPMEMMMQLDRSDNNDVRNQGSGSLRTRNMRCHRSTYHTYICSTTVGIFVLSEANRRKKDEKKISNVICIFFSGHEWIDEKKKITQMHIIKRKQN